MVGIRCRMIIFFMFCLVEIDVVSEMLSYIDVYVIWKLVNLI